MKKNIFKLLLVTSIGLNLDPVNTFASANQVPANIEIPRDAQREMFEELLTTVRTQTNMLGNSVQRILLAVQNNKVKSSLEEKRQLVAKLELIQKMIHQQLATLSQFNLNIISNAIVNNFAISKYLINKIKKNIHTLDIQELAQEIDIEFNTITPEAILGKVLHDTDSHVKNLTKLADVIGKTWYNKAYKKLTQVKAGTIVKNTALLSAATFGLYVTYKAIYPTTEQDPAQDFTKKWFHSIIGCPDRINENGDTLHATKLQHLKKLLDTFIGTPQRLIPVIDAEGNPLHLQQKEATGLLKLSSYIFPAGYLSGKIMADIAPYERIKAIYAPWWYNSKLYIYQKINLAEEALQGFSNSKKFTSVDTPPAVYFEDMTGAQHLEELAHKIANFMQHPERYERAQIEEHRGILLYGPPQTGKTFFAHALRTLIEEKFTNGQKMNFVDGNYLMDVYNKSVEACFYEAKMHAPCILFFDEVDLIGGHREKSPKTTKELLTGMSNLHMDNKQVLVIGATNKPEQLDHALQVDGRFGKQILIDYPKYENRKEFFKKELSKRSVFLEPSFIEQISQETEGCSYNSLKRIINEAVLLSDFEMQPVSEKHFEYIFDSEVRKIQHNKAMSSHEKEIIATYQAAKALIRHELQTKNQVIKITIHPVAKNIKTSDAIAIKTEKESENDKIADNQKDQRLKFGEVFTKCETDYLELAQDKNLEHECMALLAGSVALQMTFNDSFSNCNPQDRAEAMKIIYNLNSHGEKIDDTLKATALNAKEKYQKRIKEILKSKKDLLKNIVQKLLDQNTIDRYEWADLVATNFAYTSDSTVNEKEA